MPKEKEKKAKGPVKREDAGNPEEAPDKTMLRVLRLAIVCALVLLFSLIFVAWGTYSQGWQNNFLDSVYKAVPYPVAVVEYTNWIRYSDFNENVKAMRRYLENKEAAYGKSNFDFGTAEGQKRLAIIKKNILNQLIESKMVEMLAKEQGITVPKSEITEITQEVLDQEGKKNENLVQLNTLYGWKVEDFGDKIVKNMLYREKLEDKLTKSGILDKEASARVAMIQKKLDAGENFSDLAKNYSDSSSKLYGGLLPAFTREEAPLELAEAAFGLKEGEISQPVKAENGWNFVKVERRFQENGKEKVEVRNILVGKVSFDNWLENEKKDFKVTVFMPTYYWHAQLSKLFFKDDNLNQLEEEQNRAYLDEKAQEADYFINAPKQ